MPELQGSQRKILISEYELAQIIKAVLRTNGIYGIAGLSEDIIKEVQKYRYP